MEDEFGSSLVSSDLSHPYHLYSVRVDEKKNWNLEWFLYLLIIRYYLELFTGNFFIGSERAMKGWKDWLRSPVTVLVYLCKYSNHGIAKNAKRNKHEIDCLRTPPVKRKETHDQLAPIKYHRTNSIDEISSQRILQGKSRPSIFL